MLIETEEGENKPNDGQHSHSNDLQFVIDARNYSSTKCYKSREGLKNDGVGLTDLE